MICSESKEKCQDYLETISREVRYRGTEVSIGDKQGKKIPCGTLVKFSYYGSRPPRGLEIDRRYHLYE